MKTGTVPLSELFLSRMQELLGEEYPAYLQSFDAPRWNGLRVNNSKISTEEFLRIFPYELKPVPWCPNGFYYDGELRLSKDPYYHAGLFYLQEPSAMISAATLPVSKGCKVLDICAAPGGKSTELGVKIEDSGFLCSNDISSSRARALLKNLELFGTGCLAVVSEAPYVLKNRFTDYFDRILIDAPCSGEGMFRKDPDVCKAWNEKEDANALFSKLQREILDQTVPMLAYGGLLLYSTCTFAPEENEESMAYLLCEHPEFHILPGMDTPGFGHGIPEKMNEERLISRLSEEGKKVYEEQKERIFAELKNCRRLWPHHIDGEGHFVTLLVRGEYSEDSLRPSVPSPRASRSSAAECSEPLFNEFAREYLAPGFLDGSRIRVKNGYVTYAPDALPDLTGLRLLRDGVFLGNVEKNRFEPAQALALYLKKEQFAYVLDLSRDDERVIRYLKGETVFAEEDEITVADFVKKKKDSVFVLVCVDGYPLGFAKKKNNTLKNKYHPGWRMTS